MESICHRESIENCRGSPDGQIAIVDVSLVSSASSQPRQFHHIAMTQISPPELAYITDSLLAGKRTDGRALLSFREIHLSTGVVAQASGSSRVSCGGTDVLVGIKLETGDIDSDERLGVSLEM